jgi:hypothetical protein
MACSPQRELNPYFLVQLGHICSVTYTPEDSYFYCVSTCGRVQHKKEFPGVDSHDFLYGDCTTSILLFTSDDMNRELHSRLEKNYLIASAIAVFTAFLCINIYPEYHGGPQIGRSGLLALSLAMIAMMIYVVKKVLMTRKESGAEPENEELTSDPGRLKKMFFLWSIATSVLGASLVRYPLYLHFKSHEDIGLRGIGVLFMGSLIILGTIGHVIFRFRDYRKKL